MSEFAHSQIETDVSQDRLPRIAEGGALPERLDTVFDLLRSSRRRALLYYLEDEAADRIPFELVVEGVRRYEADATEDGDLPSRQDVRTSLAHGHLPRLAAFDVLEYDPREAEVRFHGTDSLAPWLDQIRDLELD